jgi:hypothetical protein
MMNTQLTIRPRHRIVDYILFVAFAIFIWKSFGYKHQLIIILFLLLGLIGYVKILWDEVHEIVIEENSILINKYFLRIRIKIINRDNLKKIIIAKSEIPGPNELYFYYFDGNKSVFTFFGDIEVVDNIDKLFSAYNIKVDKSSKLSFPQGI